MGGWKTWAGVGLLVVGGGLNVFGLHELSVYAYSAAAPMITVGVVHKIVKFAKIAIDILTKLIVVLEGQNKDKK